MLEQVKPFARAGKFFVQKHYPRWISAVRRIRSDAQTPVVFLVGCGRSGTTLLGQIVGKHPKVRFLHEPYHLWHALDPRNDAIGLFGGQGSRMFRDDSGISDRDRQRFGAVFGYARSRGRVLLEKTPYNAMRLSYLQALVPHALVLHIVRDGLDVVDSIHRIASTNDYRIAGRPNWNQWWGEADCRWTALRRDAMHQGYYRSSAYRLESHRERAAYEWLVSHREVDRHRRRFGDRIVDVNYQALLNSPLEVLARLADFLQLPTDDRWLSSAARQVTRPASTESCGAPPLALPADMAADFNHLQDRYGFRQRVAVREES